MADVASPLLVLEEAEALKSRRSNGDNDTLQGGRESVEKVVALFGRGENTPPSRPPFYYFGAGGQQTLLAPLSSIHPIYNRGVAKTFFPPTK